MSEHKAFASLSSGLLARKGSARPAMRRQGFGQVGPGGLDDLGWNDLGDPDYPDQDNEQAMIRLAQADQLEPLDDGSTDNVAEFKRNPIAMLSPATSPVHDQREELERAFGYDESEEHYDGDDIYDETAELWEGDDEDGLNIDLGVGKSEPASLNEEPKLKRTVADLIPPTVVAEGTTNPLSDFSHLPTDLSNFGKPAAPSFEADEAQPDLAAFHEEPVEPVADVDAPEEFVPFASFDDEAEATVSDEEPVAEDATPGYSGPLGPVLDALAASDEAPVDEIEDAVAFQPSQPPFEPVPFDTGIEQQVDEPVDEPVEPVAQDVVEEIEAIEPEAIEPEAIEPAEPVEVAAEIDEPVAYEAPVVEEAVVEEPAPVAVALDAIEPIASRSNDKGKAAFTLRLDPDVHLKLRLACALSGLSAQKFVSQALERALADMPELDELAAKSANRAN